MKDQKQSPEEYRAEFEEGRMTQEQVDRKLSWGIVFSICWIAGIGSILAVMSGLKANRAINSSNGTLVGKGKAWWCIIVGAIGLILWVPILIIGVVNQF